MIVFLDSAGPAFRPQHDKAIVTIVVGDEYQTVWQVMASPGWQRYAEVFGYDVIVIQAPLDTSERAQSRSPAWQKLLVLNQPWAADYRRVVWLDSDILISKIAPDVALSAPDESTVGAVVAPDQLSMAEKHIYFELKYNIQIAPEHAETAWNIFQENTFKLDDIDGEGAPILNTGVLVLTPARHNDLLLEVYEHEDRSRMYEQGYLSRALHRAGVIREMSPRFNWTVHERLELNFSQVRYEDPEEQTRVLHHLRNELEKKAYFLHFAGSMGLLKLIAGLSLKHGDILGAHWPQIEAPAPVRLSA